MFGICEKFVSMEKEQVCCRYYGAIFYLYFSFFISVLLVQECDK